MNLTNALSDDIFQTPETTRVARLVTQPAARAVTASKIYVDHNDKSFADNAAGAVKAVDNPQL